ncbi:MAG: Gfo/Idh/MocA family oxidoreductase [Candidatus Anammoximicrobium sp.]|nr:Gfo/Idh/MocA family oxidoreductase [Candidatus Anammoximicrobium sp.]
MKSQALNRRQFLRQSAVAAGAAGISLPIISAARGADSPAPSDTIAMGCIGVGGMGTGNMKVFVNLPGCRVVAVCDAYEDRRKRAKSIVDDNYGNQDCKMYADFRELLARKDIDAVMIAPQDHWHAIVATAAVKAGKDMYCEKPLGVCVDDGRQIRDAVRGAKRVFQTGTWQRSQGKFKQAVELVRHGYLGKIHTVEVSSPCAKYRPKYKGSLDAQPVPAGFDWEMWRGPAPTKPYNSGRVAWPDWYLISDYCAGFITNWGVHHLDIANWGCPQLGTEPFEVECQVVYRNEGFTDNADTWSGVFNYASGLKLIYKDDSQMKTGTRFVGDEGWVHIDRAGIWAEPESLLKVKLKPDQAPITDSDHHQDNFLACVRSRKDPVSDVDAAYVATTLGLLADISGRLKKKLKWDPKQEQFVGNDEANAMLKRPLYNGWTL